MICELLFVAVFTAFDGAGVVERVTGEEIPGKWLYLAAFLMVGVTFLVRLVRLHKGNNLVDSVAAGGQQ